jgi:hypothetical protein
MDFQIMQPEHWKQILSPWDFLDEFRVSDGTIEYFLGRAANEDGFMDDTVTGLHDQIPYSHSVLCR